MFNFRLCTSTFWRTFSIYPLLLHPNFLALFCNFFLSLPYSCILHCGKNVSVTTFYICLFDWCLLLYLQNTAYSLCFIPILFSLLFCYFFLPPYDLLHLKNASSSQLFFALVSFYVSLPTQLCLFTLFCIPSYPTLFCNFFPSNRLFGNFLSLVSFRPPFFSHAKLCLFPLFYTSTYSLLICNLSFFLTAFFTVKTASSSSHFLLFLIYVHLFFTYKTVHLPFIYTYPHSFRQFIQSLSNLFTNPMTKIASLTSILSFLSYSFIHLSLRLLLFSLFTSTLLLTSPRLSFFRNHSLLSLPLLIFPSPLFDLFFFSFPLHLSFSHSSLLPLFHYLISSL